MSFETTAPLLNNRIDGSRGFVFPLSMLKHVTLEEIADTHDLFGRTELQKHLDALHMPPLHALIIGDIMLGGRAKKILSEQGNDYPFKAVLPILQRATIVLGNLEGPLAKKAKKQERNYAYRVKPDTVYSLVQAGINVLTLANNHLVDCGRDGVLETLKTLCAAGIEPLGAGVNEKAAHRPVICRAGKLTIGLLGYYWNRRCAATRSLPGSAMDSEEELKADIERLREQVDRIIVTSHWGIPYEREPLPEDRVKARLAIDCGADAVVSHHAHVVQPFEIYRNCPIFYSIGNFTFGSGNSRGEGCMVGIRFEKDMTRVEVFPLYVKNRDPRVNYQPKVLKGESALRVLDKLRDRSGSSGRMLNIEKGYGRLELPWNRRWF